MGKFFYFFFLVPLQSLPQTPAGGVGGKGVGGGGCGAGTGSGMVNGAAVDHQDIRDGIAINTEHVSALIPFNRTYHLTLPPLPICIYICILLFVCEYSS